MFGKGHETDHDQLEHVRSGNCVEIDGGKLIGLFLCGYELQDVVSCFCGDVWLAERECGDELQDMIRQAVVMFVAYCVRESNLFEGVVPTSLIFMSITGTIFMQEYCSQVTTVEETENEVLSVMTAYTARRMTYARAR